MRFRDDYARAAVPMLPVVAPELSVGRQTVVWAWLDRRRLAAALAGGAGYGIGWLYTAAAAGAGCLVRPRGAPPARAGSQRDAETKPMQLFHVSISYLALLSVAIIVDVLVCTVAGDRTAVAAWQRRVRGREASALRRDGRAQRSSGTARGRGVVR